MIEPSWWIRSAVLLLALAVPLMTAGCAMAPTEPRPAPSIGTPSRSGVEWPTALPASDPVNAPAATIEVSTAGQLQDALDAAAPGSAISLADGFYDGEFTATGSGTEQSPIWLFGSPDAVLRGPGFEHGSVLHLHQAQHWRLLGFTVRDGRKGVMADELTGSVIQDLTVTRIGDEAVHLRTDSTDNVVRGLHISATGLREEKFGEGIYVGSAVSDWCQISDCEPDRSDRNVIIGNDIRETTAEAVDIKEGTTGGVVADNTFDGSGLTGEADSWVDVKGNGWLIQANRGSNAERSGFQVNDQAEGWGRNNLFDGNTADVGGGSGYGYELKPVADNRVNCTNTASGAPKGLTNTRCT
jgi:hypothetical protein